MDTLKNLGPMRLAVIGGVSVATVGFLIYIITQFSSQDMSLLYQELGDQDSGRIITELEAQGIPYQISKDGTSISVPQDKVLGLRMKLAEQGVPSGGSVGYELFDNADSLGTTNFLQNMNHLRALEGELSRTIASLQIIKAARVHLVLPKRELFSRKAREPSASVMLKMRGPNRLTKEQISAIQQMVASAVPSLNPSRVSIVDEKGSLLARGFEDDGTEMETMEERRLDYEIRLAREIEDLLANTVGFGKVRAEVNVLMNFDRITSTEESYDPDGQVVRSTQTVEQSANAQDSETQPVTVGNNLPDPTGGGGNEGARSQTSESRTEETVNYEISKTVTSRVREIGEVEKLSVAVVVDGTYTTNEEGDRVYQARPQAEMEQLASLVRSAIGFDIKRGDNVDVINMRFAELEMDELAEGVFLGMSKEEIMQMGKNLALVLVFALFVLLVVRPVVSRLFESRAEAEAQAALEGAGAPALAAPGGPPVVADDRIAPEELEELIDIDRVEGRVKASSVKKINEIVEKHPEEALSIIRNWMYQES
ncbi:flagellar basal-body MS-ring/collar protein FliF [Magnetospira sp. QH-2]|uniref:flagellar basal-body MS-ring/collar protein FliF n=1 Tax=Magnetospira sp. (strain QH-2) TaxID=1288970 RepID=UPI0011DC788C|nr:flagellar basal-body MS-ring/collar protein FliF [Magnetospira sp. QH-2]